MIAQGRTYASLATWDMERSRRFYEGALKLQEPPSTGGRTLRAGRGEHTVPRFRRRFRTIIVAEQRMAADTCSAKWEQIVDRMKAQQ